jgi:hypothetical protein
MPATDTPPPPPEKMDSDTDPSDKETEGDYNGAADEEDLYSLHITMIEGFLAAITMDEDCQTFGAFIDAAYTANWPASINDVVRPLFGHDFGHIAAIISPPCDHLDR